MLKLKTGFAAGALSIAIALTSIVPAQAVTFARVPVPEASNVEQVQYRYERRRDRYERRTERRWHGHRGYRDRRAGYRRHSDGWWYPLAAFGAGAIIGGAISNQPQAGSGSHTSWCANRYRSYRAYDNTFQPYGGPRQQCISPYS
ncbi:BA14K family protein [Shinella sp.]|uniref:BA14K family protein n=1 Tax=Shinella sp. TaxID=1870904 RepID=UPI003F730590